MWYLAEGEGEEEGKRGSGEGQDDTGARAGASHGLWERQGRGGDSQVRREGLSVRISVGPGRPRGGRAAVAAPPSSRRQPVVPTGASVGSGGGAASLPRRSAWRRVGLGAGGEVKWPQLSARATRCPPRLGGWQRAEAGQRSAREGSCGRRVASSQRARHRR